MVDFRNIFNASKMIIVISLVFNLALIGVIIFLSSMGNNGGIFFMSRGSAVMFSSMPPRGTMMMLTSVLLMIISYLGNFLIFLYGGYMAAKRGFDPISCGYVGLFTYAVVGLITGILGIVFGLQNVNAFETGRNAMVIIILAIVFSILDYILGMAVNYIVSKIGGSFGRAK